MKGFDETEVCIRQGELTATPGKFFTLTCFYPIMGRYTIVMKDADEPMTLCEVIVQGIVATGE